MGLGIGLVIYVNDMGWGAHRPAFNMYAAVCMCLCCCPDRGSE